MIDEVAPSIGQTIEEAGDVALDTVLGFNAQKDCEEGNIAGENGIFFNGTCHFYEVLSRLCVKIGFD